MSQDPDPSSPPSDDELRRLIQNATGGLRVVDFTSVIRFATGDAVLVPLCTGSDHDVNWYSEADKMFTVRVTPYVVSQLMRERDSAEARCQRYAKLVLELGGNPEDLVWSTDVRSFPIDLALRISDEFVEALKNAGASAELVRAVEVERRRLATR